MMTLEEVSSDVYQHVVREPYHVFASGSFNALNQSKAERVYYLLFKDAKYRLALAAGQRGNVLFSPYSAPFGGPIPVDRDCKIQPMEEATRLLISWAREKKITKIVFTLPPPFYHENFLAKMTNILHRENFQNEKVELNFHFDLQKLNEKYSNESWANAKKNLAIGLSGELVFSQCANETEEEKAFRIIEANRSLLGRTLQLTWSQVLATKKIIAADFFLVKKAEASIAGAMVFHVAPKIVQVIYWGDLPDFQQLKTMNFLSFKIFEHYKDKGIMYVDVGPAVLDNSIPNYGLMEFKESLGCAIQPKITLVKNIV